MTSPFFFIYNNHPWAKYNWFFMDIKELFKIRLYLYEGNLVNELISTLSIDFLQLKKAAQIEKKAY